MKVFRCYCFVIIALTCVIVTFAESWSSESIEMPKRRPAKPTTPPQKNFRQQNRPIIELFLGVLDTFHSGTKVELKRAKQRDAERQQISSTTFKTTDAI